MAQPSEAEFLEILTPKGDRISGLFHCFETKYSGDVSAAYLYLIQSKKMNELRSWVEDNTTYDEFEAKVLELINA